MRPSAWTPEHITTKGYEESAVIYTKELNLSTDEGLVIELNFENNGGSIHIPVDLGFVLYYIPELDSDSSDDEPGEEKDKKIQKVNQDGINLADVADKQKDKDDDADSWSDHADSEAYEKVPG